MDPSDDMPPRRHDLRLGGCRVILLGTIQGLAGESRHVQEAWNELGRPDAVLLGVGPEDITNLHRIGREGIEPFMDQDLDTGSYEDTLLPQLSRFGDIAMPPDDLLLAERLTRETGVPLEGVDMGDEAHADAYVHFVSGFQMLRGQSRQKRWVGKAAGRTGSPEELVLAHDAAFTAIKGYRQFEAAREAFMAENIKRACGGRSNVLVVVPYARAMGVAGLLVSPA